jgi:hypothetical protein
MTSIMVVDDDLIIRQSGHPPFIFAWSLGRCGKQWH